MKPGIFLAIGKELVKILTPLTAAHIYILICALVYTKLEGIKTAKNETVESFIVGLNAGQFVFKDNSELVAKYNSIKKREADWNVKNDFNNIPKTFVFVLSAHTTLGNRQMNVKSQEAKLFYIFSVPFGVITYYVMIHLIGLRFLKMVEKSCMLVWRREDEDLNDRQRELFVCLKIIAAMIIYSILLILALSSISLVQDHKFVTEITYVIDVFFSISSPENIVIYDIHHNDINAILTTMIYFVCILFAYTTTSAIWLVFYKYDLRDILCFLSGGRMYDYVHSEDQNAEESIWEYYNDPEEEKIHGILYNRQYSKGVPTTSQRKQTKFQDD